VKKKRAKPGQKGERTVKIKTPAGRRKPLSSGARRAQRSTRTRSAARSLTRSRAARPARVGGEARQRALRATAKVLFVVALGAGMGAGAKTLWSWVTSSPHFAIKEIVVRAGQRVSERDIRRLADLNEGDNIIDFRLREVVENIEIHPWVKSASVMRELPDRLVIEVVERKPVAAIALGSLYYVDGEGEIFKKILPGEDMDLPVLTGITLREVVESKESVVPLIELGISVVSVAANSNVMPAQEVSEVKLDRELGATVVRASDGLTIKVGRSELVEKWTRLESALVELGAEAPKVGELDLNYEGRVTVRLKEGYRVASARSVAPEGL